MSIQTLDTIIRVGLVLSISIAALLVVVPRAIKKYAFAGWAKIALWIATLTLISWAMLGFALDALRPRRFGFVAEWTWMFLAGFFVGVSLVLVLSRALSNKESR